MLILFCSAIETHLIILKSLGYFCSVEEKKLPYKVIGGKPTRTQYSADDVFAKIKHEEIKFIDLQFTSLPGRFHHTTISANTFTPDQMVDGLPKLDGSSIVGFTSIDDSDLILKPDPNTYAIIPWVTEKKSARMLCDICLLYTSPSPRDKRQSRMPSSA